MPESIYKKKERIRPPRVHISYDVELNNAILKKELPFVLGVISDLSGQPREPLKKLKDRQFVTIDRDNFDDVLGSIQPRLAFRVDDKLSGEADKQIGVELNFKKLEDFSPESVVNQIAPLAELLKARNKLKDLLGRIEVNDRLEEQLEAILKNTELRDKLKERLQDETRGNGETAPPTPGGR